MSGNPITIRNLGPEDAHLLDRVRPDTFADGLDPTRAWAFLATRVNELVVALDQGAVVGFAFGTMLLGPDRPTEFAINDLRVHPDYRRQGIGRRLVDRMNVLALDRGCEGIWVLVDGNNSDAAQAFCRALQGEETGGQTKYHWPLI